MSRGNTPGFAQGGRKFSITGRRASKTKGIRVSVILNNMGDALRFYRLVHNLTQRQLGELSGVDQSTIGSAERGKIEPNWVTMCLLVDAFNSLRNKANRLTLDDFRTEVPSMRDEEIV